MGSLRKKDNAVDPQGEFPTTPADYFFYLQFQAVRLRDAILERAIAATGLNLQRWRMLAVIRRIQDCSMKELALFTAIDRTTLTRAVDQLVAQELVVRWSPAGDRRRVHLALTPKGEAAYEAAADVLRRESEAMLRGVDGTRLGEAIRLQQDVLRNLAADPLEAERLIGFGPPPRRRSRARQI